MRNDAELYAAALAGGAEAFAPIVERYGDAVFGVALTRLGSFHDAQDLAQQVFLEAFQRLESLRDPARLGAWLRSITIHRAIDRIRSRDDCPEVDADMQPADTPEPHSQLERREQRDRVLAAIAGLSRPLRETTTLFYINGYSVGEVARIQGVPAGTVKRRLHDARARLKEEMMAMVDDTLRNESPRRKLAEQVLEMLTLYDRPGIPWERWNEIKARLHEIGTQGIDGFVRALESPHSPTRLFATTMLTSAGECEEIVERLLVQATKDSNKKVRKAAFSALMGLASGHEERRADLMTHVLPLLRDRSKRVRRLAWHLAHFPGLAEHVPVEQVAQAVTAEREWDARLRQDQRDLLVAVMRFHAGKRT